MPARKRTPQAPTILRRLERKGAQHERLAREVAKTPALIDQVMEGLGSDRPSVKYGCAKVLRIIATEHPALLYPRFRDFARMLDSDNRIMQWEAIHVIGHLAAVDSRGKVTRILDRYLAPLPGPVLVTAANAIGGAARIAAAKPQLADRIATKLLTVQRARYKTPECRNVALGAVIEAFNDIYPHLRDKQPALRLVRRQLKNSRPATRKKAERFLSRWNHAAL